MGKLNHITINHNAKYCFPTPETTEDPSKHSGLEKQNYEELFGFKKREMIRPLDNADNRKNFKKITQAYIDGLKIDLKNRKTQRTVSELQ